VWAIAALEFFHPKALSHGLLRLEFFQPRGNITRALPELRAGRRVACAPAVLQQRLLLLLLLLLLLPPLSPPPLLAGFSNPNPAEVNSAGA
jgi:hypothetical protein